MATACHWLHEVIGELEALLRWYNLLYTLYSVKGSTACNSKQIKLYNVIQ